MNIETVILRLEKTLDKIKSLKADEFYYGHFVSECNIELNCGTKCCVAGWYPKWFPEAELIWVNKIGIAGQFFDLVSKDPYSILEVLAFYHGVSHPTISALFYGKSLSDIFRPIDAHASLREVAERFEIIIRKLKEGDTKIRYDITGRIL